MWKGETTLSIFRKCVSLKELFNSWPTFTVEMRDKISKEALQLCCGFLAFFLWLWKKDQLPEFLAFPCFLPTEAEIILLFLVFNYIRIIMISWGRKIPIAWFEWIIWRLALTFLWFYIPHSSEEEKTPNLQCNVPKQDKMSLLFLLEFNVTSQVWVAVGILLLVRSNRSSDWFHLFSDCLFYNIKAFERIPM